MVDALYYGNPDDDALVKQASKDSKVEGLGRVLSYKVAECMIRSR